MLRSIENYNNLSPELRKRLNDARKNAGEYAKYKFYISHKNPDGERRAAGEYIFPSTYTLTPVKFTIIDPGDGMMKDIGMTTGRQRQYGDIEDMVFRRIQLSERLQGLLVLDLSVPEQIEEFEYLEMHPRFEGGMFRDNKTPAMFVRVDELKEAKTKLKARELRSTALMVATRMNEQEVRNFAAGMNWNELEDLDILKDKMTQIADSDPEFFRKFVDDPKAEYKATTKRAMDANIIAWVPLENKFIWTTNQSTIAMLERGDGKDFLDRMGDWFMSHKNGQDTYKKIKSLLAGK